MRSVKFVWWSGHLATGPRYDPRIHHVHLRDDLADEFPELWDVPDEMITGFYTEGRAYDSDLGIDPRELRIISWGPHAEIEEAALKDLIQAKVDDEEKYGAAGDKLRDQRPFVYYDGELHIGQRWDNHASLADELNLTEGDSWWEMRNNLPEIPQVWGWIHTMSKKVEIYTDFGRNLQDMSLAEEATREISNELGWDFEIMTEPSGYARLEAATVEDTEPPNNFGFLKEPHDSLYPAAFDGTKMRPEALTKIKSHILNAIEAEYPNADNFIYFTVYGSGASYNWDEDGDFDVQMWVDFQKFQDNHEVEVTQDDLLADIRRLVQPVNFPSFAELGLKSSECDGKMLIQYYPKPGTGSKEENLASQPYSCYDMETDDWLQKPDPITPQFYGEGFMLVMPKAEDIAVQAEGLINELERTVVDWEFWTAMAEKIRNPKILKRIEKSKAEAEENKKGVQVLFDNVFGGRSKAYSPEGKGMNDERDLIQKLLEVWGIFQKLKHDARAPLPWETEKDAADTGPRAAQVKLSVQDILDRYNGQRLEGLPGKVKVEGYGALDFGGHSELQDLAAQYAESQGMDYERPSDYVKIDPEYSAQIAQAYEEMEHNPNDPQVKASYDAFKKETLDQYNWLVANGYTFDFYPDEDPYPNTPREAVIDLYKNKHLYVYPTDAGFGHTEVSDHPLLELAPVKWGGQPVTYNDIFRAVHDVFGHAKEGLGFRAVGEENAWRQHAAMYSDLARPVMTAETRGQNSWVNFGPHGEANRSADQASTIYAEQKAGILPPEYSELRSPVFSKTALYDDDEEDEDTGENAEWCGISYLFFPDNNELIVGELGEAHPEILDKGDLEERMFEELVIFGRVFSTIGENYEPDFETLGVENFATDVAFFHPSEVETKENDQRCFEEVKAYLLERFPGAKVKRCKYAWGKIYWSEPDATIAAFEPEKWIRLANFKIVSADVNELAQKTFKRIWVQQVMPWMKKNLPSVDPPSDPKDRLKAVGELDAILDAESVPEELFQAQGRFRRYFYLMNQLLKDAPETHKLWTWLTARWARGQLDDQGHGHVIDILTQATQHLDRLRDDPRPEVQVPDVNQFKDWESFEAWVMDETSKTRSEMLEGEEVTVFDLGEGWTIKQLVGDNALKLEGENMGHCVGGYCDVVKSGESLIYSLRDPKNEPHATIEILGQFARLGDPPLTPLNTETDDAWQIVQIQGKQNSEPNAEYKRMIRRWFDSLQSQGVNLGWSDSYSDYAYDPYRIEEIYDVDALMTWWDSIEPDETDAYGLPLPPVEFSSDSVLSEIAEGLIAYDDGRLVRHIVENYDVDDVYAAYVEAVEKLAPDEVTSGRIRQVIEAEAARIEKSIDTSRMDSDHYIFDNLVYYWNENHPDEEMPLEYWEDEELAPVYEELERELRRPWQQSLDFLQKLGERYGAWGIKPIKTVGSWKVMPRISRLGGFFVWTADIHELAEKQRNNLLNREDVLKWGEETYPVNAEVQPIKKLNVLRNFLEMVPDEGYKLMPWVVRAFKKGEITLPTYAHALDIVQGAARWLEWSREHNKSVPDYMKKDFTFDRMEEWVYEMNATEIKDESGWVDSKPVYTWEDGWHMDLVGADDLAREGELMGHCVGGYCEYVRRGDTSIFSLRDPKGQPHVTIEVRGNELDFLTEGYGEVDYNGRTIEVVQVQGKQDTVPIPEYREKVDAWFADIESRGWEIDENDPDREPEYEYEPHPDGPVELNSLEDLQEYYRLLMNESWVFEDDDDPDFDFANNTYTYINPRPLVFNDNHIRSRAIEIINAAMYREMDADELFPLVQALYLAFVHEARQSYGREDEGTRWNNIIEGVKQYVDKRLAPKENWPDQTLFSPEEYDLGQQTRPEIDAIINYWERIAEAPMKFEQQRGYSLPGDDERPMVEQNLYFPGEGVWGQGTGAFDAWFKYHGLDSLKPLQSMAGWNRVADWNDIQEKAWRFRNDVPMRVKIQDNNPEYVSAIVEGDHGTYKTEIWREPEAGNPNAITRWKCSCPWGEVSWGRTRKWKKYEGRPCSHTLALQWEAQSNLPQPEEQLPIPGVAAPPQPGQLAPYDPNALYQNPENLPQPSRLKAPNEVTPLELPGTFSKKAGMYVVRWFYYKPHKRIYVNQGEDMTHGNMQWRLFEDDDLFDLTAGGYVYGNEQYLEVTTDWNQTKTPDAEFEEQVKAEYQKMREPQLELDWKEASFNSGEKVRARQPVWGMDDRGTDYIVPRNMAGEVLWSDDDSAIVIFSIDSGPYGPHVVKVEDDADLFYSDPKARPFIGP